MTGRRRAVRCEPVPGGVRVVARDWPGAPWVAVPCLAAGIPTLVWAVLAGHPIEAGGGIVLSAFGALAAWLALARRRDVVVAVGPGGAAIRGREGAGPFARPVAIPLPAGARVEVAPFAVPEGAPDLPDRGGDLVLAGGGARVPLARRVGEGWREELDAAAALLRDVLAGSSSGRAHPPRPGEPTAPSEPSPGLAPES